MYPRSAQLFCSMKRTVTPLYLYLDFSRYVIIRREERNITPIDRSVLNNISIAFSRVKFSINFLAKYIIEKMRKYLKIFINKRKTGSFLNFLVYLIFSFLSILFHK